MIALLLACRPPEAPDTIEEMAVYGFVHFDDDDHVEALAAKLVPFVESHREESAAGYEVNRLAAEDLAAAGVEGASVEGVVGAAVAYDYAVAPPGLSYGLTWPHAEEIFSSYLDFEYSEEVEGPCFVAQECAWHASRQDIHGAMGLGIEAWYGFDAEFRWVETDEHGLVLITRYLSPDPVELSVEWLEIAQQYAMSVAWAREDGSTGRLQAIWVEGALQDGELPESTVLNLGISQMKGSAEDLDAWLAANWEG